jgi:hypothetical protein
VFLLGVPLAWAVLLIFHPAPDPADVYGSLRGDATAMVVVHAGTLVIVGLLGAAIFLLVRDLPGIATGVLVEHGDARAARALWDDTLTGEVLPALSAIALLHAPPTGPAGLLCFAGAVAVPAQNTQRTRMPRLLAT